MIFILLFIIGIMLCGGKMKNTKIFLLILVIFLVVFAGIKIFVYSKKTNLESTKLTLLTEEYPPISYKGADGKATGIATDVVTEIMKRLGVNYEIQILKWDDAYSKALKDPNVVLFSTEKTKERENLFNWVGPLGSNKTYFYSRNDSNLNITNLNEAKAVSKIATCSSWFTEQYLKDQGFANLESYQDPKDDIKKLIGKEVDLSVFTDMTVGNLVKDAGYSLSDIKPQYKLMETQFYIAFSKGTPENITSDWQKTFDEIKKDGTLTKIYQKYTPNLEPPK
jgi:polar amino acid transport system substrate-binding protein